MPNHPFSLSMPPTLKLLHIKRTRRKSVEISPTKLHPSSDPCFILFLLWSWHPRYFIRQMINFLHPQHMEFRDLQVCLCFLGISSSYKQWIPLVPSQEFQRQTASKTKSHYQKIKRKPFRIFQESLLLASSQLSISYKGFMSVGRTGTTIRNRNEWYFFLKKKVV